MKALRSRKGFTLIELIIVIIIIGILAAVAVPKYLEIKEQAGDATAQGLIGALRGANSILFAQGSLKNWFVAPTSSFYTLGDVINSANIQGISFQTIAANAASFSIAGAGQYTITYTAPDTYNAAIIKCHYARDATGTAACANW